MDKICIISTVELPIIFFMIPHLKMLQQHYDLTVIVNTDNTDFLKEYGIRAKVIPVQIERKISLFRDIKALFRLLVLFRHHQFKIIHSIAPKAGLLAMLAGMMAGVPRRLHCFTGQVWATSTGIKRYFLKSFDKIIAACATHLLTDSHSQKDFLVQEKIITRGKITVLSSGSVSGVDTNRFKPDMYKRELIRKQHNIPTDTTLFIFLGRLTRDKGVYDLTQAFARLIEGGISAFLLIVGPDEENLQDYIINKLGHTHKYVRFSGYTKTPEDFMAAADIICLPSYREGFGMVLMEAASVGIPSIASDIYGITDAVINQVTGLLHPPGDVDRIFSCMHCLCSDVNKRTNMGNIAQQRAHKEFAQPLLLMAMLDFYSKMVPRNETFL